MRIALLALVACLALAGCGEPNGGVIQPESKSKGGASSPLDHAPKPPAAPEASTTS